MGDLDEYKFSDFLKKITFKTTIYNKNFDIIEKNESFVTEYAGVISYVRINEEKPPIQIGEFYINSFNLELANLCHVDLNKVILKHKNEDSYKDLINLIKNNEIDLSKYDRLLYINNYILKPEYRKKGITTEFIEYIYRNFYDKNTLILCLVKPFQLITDDFRYFLKERKIDIREELVTKKTKTISAKDFYSLSDLNNICDMELNEYKLFALACKNEFNRIGDSYIFTYEPKNIIKRIKLKVKEKINDDLFNN